MLECERMVLKRALQIGLRRMAGVARFGEQAQVGQTQLRHQPLVRRQHLGTGGAPEGGIGKGEQEQRQTKGEEGESAM